MKAIGMIIVVTLLLGLSAVAYAEAPDEQTAPLYTVTIPKLLALEAGENELPITVTGLEKGQSVTITFEGTQEPTTGRLPPQFVLRNPDAESLGYNEIFRYELMDERGAALPDNPESIGAALLVFAWDDTGSVHIRTADPERSRLMPGSPYTGYIVFGIKPDGV